MIPVLAWFVVAASEAPAQAPQADEPALIAVLGFVDVPLTRSLLSAEGADLATLRAIALDESQRPYVRVRATSALAVVGGVEASSTLAALAQSDTHPEVRIEALWTLSSRRNPDTEDVIARVLRSEPGDAVMAGALRAARRLDADADPSPGRVRRVEQPSDEARHGADAEHRLR